MDKAQIQHLGMLARIKLSEQEVDTLATEISSILEYVSTINSLVDVEAGEQAVGPVHNVFREDQITTPSGTHTADMLAAMPETDGAFLKVKKILDQSH